LLVEDHPGKARKSDDTRLHHTVVCSARTQHSLRDNKKRLLQYLDSHPECRISDVAYTTTARRSHDVLRSSFSVDTTEELARLLALGINEFNDMSTKRADRPTKVVFIFTGQGSVYPGMGNQLFQTSARFKRSILSYQEICDSLGLPEVIDMIVNSNAEVGSKSITQTQLALVFLELAITDLWISWGVRPNLLMGHSLGEYSALCVSGVLSVSDTLYLVAKRAALMQERCQDNSHAMLAIRASSRTSEDAISILGLVSSQVSCLNSQSDTVVSGPIKELESLQENLKTRKITATFLKVPYGFHSAQMDPILGDYEAVARGIPFAKPRIPIASTLFALIVNDRGTFSPKYLARQAREPVRFLETLRTLRSEANIDEQTLWVETGPNQACLGFVHSVLEPLSTKVLPSIKSNEDNWKTISSSVAHMYTSFAEINWVDYHREYVDELTLLQLPTYAFDVHDYWATYRENDSPATEKMSEAKAPRPILTTCLQYVEETVCDAGNLSVSFITYTSDENFHDLIQGHLVDNVALCPASVFCDMAYTAAKHLYEKARPEEPVPQMSIGVLEITHPLVVPVKDPVHLVKVIARKTSEYEWAVNVAFISTLNGESCDHGSCQVRFRKAEDIETSYMAVSQLVQKRSDALRHSADAGLSHRLMKPIIYKLFASLVSYADSYQSLDEVFIDKNYDDAVATVRLRPKIGTGTFTCSPYWLDALIHLAGFLLNSNVTNTADIAFVATGFQSLSLYEELSADINYTSYAYVRPAQKNGVFVGYVYVLQGDRVIAQCERISFQKMSRSVLSTVLRQNSPYLKSDIKPQAIAPKSRTPSYKNTSSNNRIQSFSRSYTLGKSSSSDLGTEEDHVHTPSSGLPHSNRSEADRALSLLRIIASETGFDIKDMDPSTAFSDIGVDSLMSIAIISAAQRQLGLELPASFFIDHPTIQDLGQEVEMVVQTPSDNSSSKGFDSPAKRRKDLSLSGYPTSPANKDSQPAALKAMDTSIAVPDMTTSIEESAGSVSRWTSDMILVHGRATSPSTPVFLIPGGAGSATAFIHLPPLRAGNRIFALQSPFLKSPLEYTSSIEQVSEVFLEAIRRIQPKGPYIIGGYSVGAAFAYEVTRQLVEQEEKILGLIIIDMRVPQPMPDALGTIVELIDRTDMVTGICHSGKPKNPATKEMKEHLLGSVNALKRYTAVPMTPLRRPRYTYVIWAKQGVGETSSDDTTGNEKDTIFENGRSGRNIMEDSSTGLEEWFFAKRTSFGSNGWDRLVGDTECHAIDGNHFSILKPPHVSQTVSFRIVHRISNGTHVGSHDC